MLATVFPAVDEDAVAGGWNTTISPSFGEHGQLLAVRHGLSELQCRRYAR
jgi:hypothetical protein